MLYIHEMDVTCKNSIRQYTAVYAQYTHWIVAKTLILPGFEWASYTSIRSIRQV